MTTDDEVMPVLTDGHEMERLVQRVVDWLKPYLQKKYGVGNYTVGTWITEWVICDKNGDVLDEPFFSLSDADLAIHKEVVAKLEARIKELKDQWATAMAEMDLREEAIAINIRQYETKLTQARAEVAREMFAFVKGYTETRLAQETHYTEDMGLRRLLSVLKSKYGIKE